MLNKVEGAQRFALTACVPTGLDQPYAPTHTVELRLDSQGTPYVHTYSILHAVSNALLRPGHEIVSLDRMEIRKLIARDLLLSVGDIPHHTHFPGADPALRIVVSFEDGKQREVLGYDFGSEVTRRDAPFMAAITGVLAQTDESTRMAFNEIFQWSRFPGLRIANWIMSSAHSAIDRIKEEDPRHLPMIVHFTPPLIHSFKGFDLPGPEDIFDGPINFRSKIDDVRPTRNVQGGAVIASSVELVQNGTRRGGGTVKFAFSPHCVS